MGVSQADIDALLATAEGLAAEAGPTDATAASSQTAGALATPAPPAPAAPAAGPRPGTDVKRILSLTVPVIVELADQEMPVRKVLDFKPGSIIEFEKAFDADLSLVVANRCIGVGQAVKVGENFGLRVTNISRLDQTIKALGGG